MTEKKQINGPIGGQEQKALGQEDLEMSRHVTFMEAVKWAFVRNWGRQGITSIVTFILASILGPHDFGTVAIASVYIAFIQMLLGFGFDTAIIQRKDLKSLHVDSVFWVILIASILLAGVSIVLSNWWARVNHLPELALVICVLSLTIPIRGLIIVQQALLSRKMDFKKLALRDNVSALSGGAVGIGMAFAGYGVWALVGQQVFMAVISLILLWKLSQWRPSVRFSIQHAKDLLGFSATVFIGRSAGFLQRHSDVLLIGIFFGPAAVGLYRLADRLMNMPLQLVTKAIHTVSLPHFSRYQESRVKLKESLLSSWRLSTIMTIPAMMGLAAMSDLLIGMIGPQWAHASDVLKILCFVGAAKSITLFTGTMLNAVSRPGIRAMMVWGLGVANTLAFLTLGIVLRDASMPHQVMGIAVSKASLFVLVFFPVNMLIVGRIAGIRARDFFVTCGPSIIVGLLVIPGIIAVESVCRQIGLGLLFTLIATGAFAFFLSSGALLLIDKQTRKRVFDICSKGLNPFIHNFRPESNPKGVD